MTGRESEGRMRIERAVAPELLAALDAAMDELSQRSPAFHATAQLPELGMSPVAVAPWTVVARRGKAFDAASGRFTAPKRGHYPFVATAGPDADLLLVKNGEVVAAALDEWPSLLVAALHLERGDVVELHAARLPESAQSLAVCWRGARW